VLDGVIRGAREHKLHLVLLWFGSWKNGESTYAPDWVKKDFERFPRVQRTAGTSIEVLTPFNDANRDADARAFAALMRHVREFDSRHHTVIMIQVENEIGALDHAPVAQKAHDGPVPRELMDYLQQHQQTLIPELKTVWEKAGAKTSGTWKRSSARATSPMKIFMGWYLARYTGRVAEAGKAQVPPADVRQRLGARFPQARPAERRHRSPWPT